MRTSSRSLVRAGASIRLRTADAPLRGEAKLEAALVAFAIDVRGRIALDLGAAAAIEAAGWRVVATADSPVTGGRGAVEAFVYATRVPPCASTS